jgi:hypothetical protein
LEDGGVCSCEELSFLFGDFFWETSSFCIKESSDTSSSYDSNSPPIK